MIVDDDFDELFAAALANGGQVMDGSVPTEHGEAPSSLDRSPFRMGDRAYDNAFATEGTICATDNNHHGAGGQVLVDKEDTTCVTAWRTRGQLERREQLIVPSKRPAEQGDIRGFFPGDRASRARPDPEPAGGAGGGASRSGSSGGGSTGRGFVRAGVKLAEHERARVHPQQQPSSTPGPRKARAFTGASKGKVTRIDPLERVKSNPGHALSVLAGALHCECCATPLANGASQVAQHLKTDKHKANLEKWAKRGKEDDAAKVFTFEDLSVPADVQLVRFRTVEAFMGSGLEISKIDGLRALLEGNGVSLGSSSSLRPYIPEVLEREMERLKADLSGEHICISFDGTTRPGEAVNATARYCSKDFQIVSRLALFFLTTAKHLDGAGTARVLTQLLLSRLCLDITRVVGVVRASAPSNGVAVRNLVGTFSCSVDIPCVSHTLNHIGEHFDLPTLSSFMLPFINLVCSPSAARVLWKDLIGEPPARFSAVHWWSKAEIAMQIARHFEKLDEFFRKLIDDGINRASAHEMLQVYSERKDALRLELAAVLDMRILVQTTHELDGDRLELLLAYDRIDALRSLGRTLSQPGVLRNVDAVLRSTIRLVPGLKLRTNFPTRGGFRDAKIVSGPADVASTINPGTVAPAWKVEHTDECTEELEEVELRRLLAVTHSKSHKDVVAGLASGFKYLEDRLTGKCSAPLNCAPELEFFDLVRAFNPTFACEKRINAEWVRKLFQISPLACADDLLEPMCAELPRYLAEAKDVRIDRKSVDDFTKAVLEFWRFRVRILPSWARAARIVFALSCNSASCERVFSLMESMFPFTSQQTCVLSDDIGGAVMLKYNKRGLG
ncbi:hypothetical protein KFE25_008354 [Diacronema lutheri]|uniref:U1-type domain-containing protein n=1 Tax=Diacronema lutheri TaxID=2081491 RepID=A0A8J5XWZ0_DIALT|nr:hypothetical protein KFE25_008354 [Diacronema lutheri]